MNLRIVLVALVLPLVSCFDYGVKWEDEPYQVIWIDRPSRHDLVYGNGDGTSTGRIGPDLVAVGSNAEFIVAKTQIGSFYYIDREKDTIFSGTNAVTGPLSNEAFLTLKIKLALPEFSELF